MKIDDIFHSVQDFCDRNHYVDVADKVPVFICSIGAHLFNTINKCSMCDFDPDKGAEYAIENCPMRHDRHPSYVPMSRVADTRIHILMRGPKGSGKNVLLDLFCADNTGLLWNADSFKGIGFRTMVGPNSITEAGLFGSVDEDGIVMGRPLARELCGGFLCFEEFSSLTDATKKEHSMDLKNQMLTSLDSGRVNKGMRSGWVRYNTRYTCWAGTQPARFELVSGLDRRFFIIDIEMTAEKERAFKIAQNKQANMTKEEHIELAERILDMRKWFIDRQMKAVLNPPSGVTFAKDFEEWVLRDTVRSFESDLFRRLAIGYHMMNGDWTAGEPLRVTIDERLSAILESSLLMRRNVMDADLALVKTTFWRQDLPRSQFVKEIARMITNGDYSQAKRWIEENLMTEHWFSEYTPRKFGQRGRRGVVVRIGPPKDEESDETET